MGVKTFSFIVGKSFSVKYLKAGLSSNDFKISCSLSRNVTRLLEERRPEGEKIEFINLFFDASGSLCLFRFLIAFTWRWRVQRIWPTLGNVVLIAFTNAISSSVPNVSFSSGRSYHKLDRILAKKSQYVEYAPSQCRKTGPNITGGVVFPLLNKFELVYTIVVT